MNKMTDNRRLAFREVIAGRVAHTNVFQIGFNSGRQENYPEWRSADEVDGNWDIVGDPPVSGRVLRAMDDAGWLYVPRGGGIGGYQEVILTEAGAEFCRADGIEVPEGRVYEWRLAQQEATV